MQNLAVAAYDELKAEYDQIINEPIVLASPQDPTIFDISRYPHYEVVISNWYAFFFDPSAEHSLGDLFLQSLIEIINEYHNEFFMEDCRVEREFQTAKGGSIDMVLYQQSEEGEEFETAIIIENKIRAGLNNDLDDYYESVKVDEPNQKVGLVLSLDKIEVPHQKFINITHEELLEVVQQNLGKYVVSARPKYIPYLQDFIYNLEQMTRPDKMQDSIKFYFERAEKIQELLTLRSHAYHHVDNDLYRVIQADADWEWGRVSSKSASFRRYNPEIWCYLSHYEIFETKKYQLEMWLKGEEVVQIWKKTEGQKRIYSKYKDRFKSEKDIGNNTIWVPLGKKEYEGVILKDIEKFGETILQILNDDWAELIEDVTNLLDTK